MKMRERMVRFTHASGQLVRGNGLTGGYPGFR